MPAQQRQLTRAEQRQQGAEGGLAPVVLALALSAVFGTVLGSLLLSRDLGVRPAVFFHSPRATSGSVPSISSRQQREQLFSRLRALQVDRSWFLKLVDSSLLQRHPERARRLPSYALEDKAMRRIWIDLAQDWLSRIERLPPSLRARLGSLSDAEWHSSSRRLTDQGIHPSVLERLVGAASRDLLPVHIGLFPNEPYRQLWIAASMRIHDDLRVETIPAQSTEVVKRSLRIPARGAQLIMVFVPPEHNLVLGVNGSPLMQMSVFRSDGTVLHQRGALRVISLHSGVGSPLQMLITNDGVASGLITLFCQTKSNK